MNIADGIVKETEQAREQLESARRQLVDAVLGGESLSAEQVVDVKRREVRLQMWETVLRTFDHEFRKGDASAERAAFTAVSKGRARCAERLISGPAGTSSLAVRALSEAAQDELRAMHAVLDRYAS
ncbi:hypothetical protein ACIRPQ_29365 [Streptomyces sp. NPDC101213]|uniref:hypothetical protein n=1 Tax=Streptomyces sp. NPDC101213 TaxID=3366130 RepID=UPI0037FD1094